MFSRVFDYNKSSGVYLPVITKHILTFSHLSIKIIYWQPAAYGIVNLKINQSHKSQDLNIEYKKMTGIITISG